MPVNDGVTRLPHPTCGQTRIRRVLFHIEEDQRKGAPSLRKCLLGDVAPPHCTALLTQPTLAPRSLCAASARPAQPPAPAPGSALRSTSATGAFTWRAPRRRQARRQARRALPATSPCSARTPRARTSLSKHFLRNRAAPGPVHSRRSGRPRSFVSSPEPISPNSLRMRSAGMPRHVRAADAHSSVRVGPRRPVARRGRGPGPVHPALLCLPASLLLHGARVSRGGAVERILQDDGVVWTLGPEALGHPPSFAGLAEAAPGLPDVAYGRFASVTGSRPA